MREKIFKTILTTLLFISILSAGAAEENSLDVDISETEWAETDYRVTGEATCENDEDIRVELNSEEYDESSDFNLVVEEYGDHTITLYCDDTNEEEFEFSLNYFESFNFEGYAEDKTEYYNRETLEIETSFEFGDDTYQMSEENLEIEKLAIRGENEELRDQTVEEINDNEVTLSGEVPNYDEVDPGDQDLDIEVSYEGQTKSVTTSSQFEIKDRWEFNVLETNVTSGTIELNELNEYEPFMLVEIREKGDILQGNDISSNDFYIESDDTDITGSIEGVYRSGSNAFEIEFTAIPDLEIGEYEFEIGIEDNGEKKKIDDFLVLNYISFEGTVLDHHEDGVDTVFEITGDSEAWRDIHAGSKTVEAENGIYQASVLPDYYNLTMNFEDNVMFHMENTDMTQDGLQNINYDTIPRSSLNDEVEGVNVVKAMGILYGYNFDGGRAKIDYEHGDVTAENARILKCDEWYMSRDCESGWERMDTDKIDVNPTQPSVQFPVEPQSRGNDTYLMTGYALVENTDLITEIEIENGRVALGEGVDFEGRVESPSGDAVQDVTTTIEIRDGDEVLSSQETQSNENGVFGLSISAPETEGTYDVRLLSEKEPYNDFELNETGVIDTYIERSIDVSGPDQIELPTGETVVEEVTVINDGQASLEDVRLYLNGISSEWYDITGVEDELDEGSSFTATIEITAPEDHFSEENLENENYDIEARAMSDGSEINTMLDGVATITNEHNTEGETTEERGASFNAPDMPTGEFLASQSSLNIALSMITIFTLVLATAVKKKKDEDNNGRSSSRTFSASGSGLGGGSPSMNRQTSNNRVNKPNISSKSSSSVEKEKEQQEEEEDKEEKEEVKQKEEKTEKVKQDSETNKTNNKPTCGVCGESFDTESALTLHKKTLH